MITPEQNEAMLAAVEEYLAAQQVVADTFVGNAYAHGRDGIASLVGASVVQTSIEEERIAALVDANFNKIVSTSGRWIEDIQSVVGDGYLAGESPVDIAGRVSNYFDRMPGNWSVISRDQVAKAQHEGRNATYQQIGQTQCEVTCAPDACEECDPYDGMVVKVDDETNRPQYHIQCACMDVPTVEDEEESSQTELDDAQSESQEGDHSSGREEQ